MTDSLLPRLSADEAACKAATPGPWKLHVPNTRWMAPQILEYGGGILAEMTSYGRDRTDAAFIARFSPDYILKFLHLASVAADLKHERLCSTRTSVSAACNCYLSEIGPALQALAEHGETAP